MRLLRRNTTEFQYYGYTGLGSDVDEETGLHTGVWKPMYATPVTYRGTISTPDGTAEITLAGLDVRYTHILVMDDPDVDIRETGYIVWRGREYDINAVLPSLNVLSVALQQRTKDNGDQYEEPEEEPQEEEQAGDEP